MSNMLIIISKWYINTFNNFPIIVLNTRKFKLILKKIKYLFCTYHRLKSLENFEIQSSSSHKNFITTQRDFII